MLNIDKIKDQCKYHLEVVPGLLWDTFEPSVLIDKHHLVLFDDIPQNVVTKYHKGLSNMEMGGRLPSPDMFFVDRVVVMVPTVYNPVLMGVVLNLNFKLWIGCKWYLNRPIGTCYMAPLESDPVDLLSDAYTKAVDPNKAWSLFCGLLSRSYGIFTSSSFESVGGIPILQAQSFYIEITRMAGLNFEQVEAMTGSLPPVWVFIDGLLARGVS